jgi:hypothetical protein
MRRQLHALAGEEFKDERQLRILRIHLDVPWELRGDQQAGCDHPQRSEEGSNDRKAGRGGCAAPHSAPRGRHW